ncbi:T9SS sorting signal type C domain-containing protein [Flavobacterium lacus]|uniref:Autotransporter-associated beta strand protein n=1 Tax=Flavobacterium lacus TaxID=1353778 RepID=A0A328WLC7_9FLAO|nr:T9SS sorting signal type C domain-containing protein [Flavobacterium lacus]RAR46993.1 autotransporter-associated beta strand protein [Flavobacterium lacus]
MEKNYTHFIFKPLGGTLFLCLFLMVSFGVLGQQNVFHRDNANTGDWGSGNLPWFYQTSNNNQGDPDNGNTTRNDVFIGHNNNTTMSLNGRFYLHRDFTFQTGASTARTLNNTTGGGFSFSRSLINASTATHIFNTPVGIDATNSEIVLSNGSGGSFTFNGSVFTNNNLVFLRNSNGNTGTITFNGAVPNGGSFVKQNGGTANFTGSADFSGSIFIDEGTVRVGRNLGSNVIEIGGGIAASSPLNATLEVANGGTTISKGITVKNFNSIGGNRAITFSHPSSTTATLSGTIALEKVVTITNPSTNNGAILSNTISGVGGITKAGTGLLTISSGTVTYSGATTISAGEVRFNPSGNLTLSTAFTLENGAVLATTGIASTRTLTSSGANATFRLNSGTATLALGTSAHTITFANSSSVTWAGTTLTITGWVGTAGQAGTSGRVFFGNSASGLTTSQLDKINFTGFPNGAQLLATGELVPRCANPTNGGTIAGNQALCSGGDPAAFTSTTNPSGQTGTLVYQWQISTTSSTAGFSDISGATSDVYDAPAGITQTTWFKRLARVTCQPDWTNAAESNVLELTIASTTWTPANGGSWTNGVPTATTAAIISADYAEAVNMTACSLTINNNAIVTIPAGNNVILNGALTVDSGSFTLENNANLIQSGTTNDNLGDVTVFRNSSSLFRLDYTLWSSPVAGQNLLAFSPNTLANRFYTYNSGTNNYSPIVPSTNDFAAGVGYLIRMPDNHPTTTATLWSGQFNGVPNNGNVSVSVANDTYNAVGNPYPSTIDADDFINANSLTEALYFWRKTNGASGSAYATYTLAGGVGTDSSDSSSQVPNGIIQVGQGFIVKSTSTTINFDNTMRIGDNGNQFFRNSSEIENNRIRLTATGANGFYSQVLVNYRSEATDAYDAALDGRYINDSDTAFYTLLDQEPFVIQARALPFEQTDVVNLGFQTTTAGTFTLTLNEKDGVFAANSTIFIKDNALGIWHNITESPYEFVSEVGTFSARLELVYQEPLSVIESAVTANHFIVVKENNGLTVRSVNEAIATVTVFDLSGRQIASSQNNSSTSVTVPLGTTQTQVLLLQVVTQDGLVVSKKVVY